MARHKHDTHTTDGYSNSKTWRPSGWINPNGPELPETLKVREKGQMAHNFILSVLAGAWLFEVHMDPPFFRTKEGPAYRDF